MLVTSSGSSPPELQFAMVVQGTPLAPGAHGSATLTKKTSGWEIKLNATGLPRREGRQFYQAWLKNAAGVLVPVGTFNDARNVTLWSGVPVTKFRSLTVTQQVANGNPKSSGRPRAHRHDPLTGGQRPRTVRGAGPYLGFETPTRTTSTEGTTHGDPQT